MLTPWSPIVDWLINTRHQDGAAIALLVLFSIFLLFMSATYIRLILIIKLNPGLVPLGPGAEEARSKSRGASYRTRREPGGTEGGGDIEALQYDPGPEANRDRGLDRSTSSTPSPDLDPDSPGLEKFYSKDVFVCDTDGRPRWCSACRAWKPDRSHHSRELNRCVRKMDHFCPWVGGIVSETCE